MIRLYPALIGLVVVSVVLYAAAPDSPLTGAEVARRGVLALGQVVRLLGCHPERSALADRPSTPSRRPGRWRSSGTSTCSGRSPSSGARMRGWGPRRLATVSLAVAAPLYLLSLPLGGFWFYFGPSARFAELLAGGALALWFQAHGTPTRTWRYATPASVLALAEHRRLLPVRARAR